MNDSRPFRVLSLDGGGMRGTYTATYLLHVANAFARKRGVADLDVGRAFDLIVGTSTGGIVACALAAGVPLANVVDLYRAHGPRIFERRLPNRLGVRLIMDVLRRPGALARGNDTLRAALRDCLGSKTLAELYERRHIALAITSVDVSNNRSWVFKTPHFPATNHRDDGYTLVDVCLATTAAPIYRSLAQLEHPDGRNGCRTFVDGGLWANNPVLVGLIEALDMAGPGNAIEVFSLGTCPRPAGQDMIERNVHRGLAQWNFGGTVAALGVDAQEFAYDHMARKLAAHVNRPCEIVRFPHDQIPASLMNYLDLDETRPRAIDALENQARTDADMTNSKCARPDDREGRLISALFMDTPPAAEPYEEARRATAS